MMHPPAGKRSEAHPPPADGDPTVRLEAEDTRTLAALYDRHAGAMYSLAMRVTGEPSDAEAIVRGVFAAVWSEAGRRSGAYAPNVYWLLSTTRIRAIDHVRARGAAAEAAPSVTGANDASTDTQTGDVATLHIPDPVHGGSTSDVDPEDAPRLRAAFRGLPPLERLAIDLAYFEGLTISQIAARLEQPPEVANARIRTALRRLAGSTAPRRPSEPPRDAPPTRDRAALYALGALSARERAAFDAHIEVHRESVDEVMSLLPIARRLAWAAPPHEPPPGLCERVVETVTGAPLIRAPLPDTPEEETAESSRPMDAGDRPASTTEDGLNTSGDGDRLESANRTYGSERGAETGSPEPAPPDAGAESADAVDGEPADGDEGAATTNDGSGASPSDAGGRHAASTHEPAPAVGAAAPSPLIPPPEEPTAAVQEAMPPTEQKKSGRWGLLSLAAGSLVVAAGLGVFAARQANLATALQENLDAANTQARIAEMETVAAQRIAGEHRETARVLTAADVRMLDLAGQPAAPAARGRLFWSASEGGLVAVTGLPAAPPGRIYQLWLIPGTLPMSAALLPAGAAGRAMAAVTPPEGVTAPVPAAVTLEPAGGATTPSGEVYLLGRP